MENWLDFDYRQMSDVQNPMMNPMGTYQQPLMPNPMMPCNKQAVSTNPLEFPPSPVPTPSTNTAGNTTIPVQNNPNYLQGYLKSQLGKNIRVDFLVGTGILTDRAGKLVSVGIDYIILNPSGSNDLEVCDLYSIKFVEIFGAANQPARTESE